MILSIIMMNTMIFTRLVETSQIVIYLTYCRTKFLFLWWIKSAHLLIVVSKLFKKHKRTCIRWPIVMSARACTRFFCNIFSFLILISLVINRISCKRNLRFRKYQLKEHVNTLNYMEVQVLKNHIQHKLSETERWK